MRVRRFPPLLRFEPVSITSRFAATKSGAAIHDAAFLILFYFANSVQRVSRMTLTLICPGYSSSFSMRLATSRAST